MFSIYWAKLGFDSGNAAGAKFVYEVIIPINKLLLNLSNEFDLLQSAIYLYIFRNHFVNKFVYRWVMKANLK